MNKLFWAARPLIEPEWPQIDAAWAWMLARMADGSDPETDAVLLDMANATADAGEFHYDRQRERIPQFEAKVAAARRLGRTDAEVEALNALGGAYVHLGDYQRAIAFYEQLLILVHASDNRNGEAATLVHLAGAYRDLGEDERAIGYQEQLRQVCEEIAAAAWDGNV
jgi:tetratricopeptide (TPR) repeat protein